MVRGRHLFQTPRILLIVTCARMKTQAKMDEEQHHIQEIKRLRSASEFQLRSTKDHLRGELDKVRKQFEEKLATYNDVIENNERQMLLVSENELCDELKKNIHG